MRDLRTLARRDGGVKPRSDCVTRGRPIPERSLPHRLASGVPLARRIAQPFPTIAMPARTFEDSSGTVWEVFEVHRASQKAGAVSAGLERGWLSFVSSDAKRRLAPFPGDWASVPDDELERLCGRARVANASMFPARQPGPRIHQSSGGAAPASTATPEQPRRERDDVSSAGAVVEPKRPSTLVPAVGDDPVEVAVRRFAHDARARGLPAIEAMVELKGVLTGLFPEADSGARDRRSVRRWFVEAYYFERRG